ncbi:MAG: FG-GAP repeat domain-containing protein [Anaerolineae bacterium]
MELVWQNRRVWSVLATPLVAFLMLVAILAGLGSMREATAAPIQDDGRGWWTDTFTDALGLDQAVNVVVDTGQARLELEPPVVLSQTDWSGGSGLLTTTDTSTSRYAVGARVNPLFAGDLFLGFTLPVSDDMVSFEQDGYPDLVLSNYYSGTIGSGGDYADESYLYYGSASGFTDTNRAELPARSASGNAIADLNNDGFLDIAVARGNTADTLNGPAYIYWGSSDGYAESNRTELSSYVSTCSIASDLDQDGYLDIVICNFMDSSFNLTTDSYIYWGSSSGYTDTNRTDLPTIGAVAAYAADFDKDGRLDLMFSNYRNGNSELLTTTFAISSYLYWGRGTGYTVTNRTDLPTVGAYGDSAADLNLDGYLDIVISNRRTGGSEAVTSTHEINSYVYWGSSAGFTETNRLELPTVGSYGNSVADLNGDGYPEIVFSNHYNGITYALNSYIYWNNAGTFTIANRSELPTTGATGNCVGDLDLDGYLDIVFSSRRSGDDHNVPSYIYWGSSSVEYTTTNRTTLNTHGALGCSIAGGTIAAANTAYGNVYAMPITGSTTITDTATTPRIYATSGVITSTGFDSGEAHVWQQMTWNASIPTGTDIALDVATSDDGVTWSDWSQVAASSNDGANSASLDVADARFIRYRATLTASTDHQQTPVLRDIQITGGRTGGNATSVTITPAALDRWNTITWTAQVAAGQAITVQVLDSSSTLIPDIVLPGNSSGFSSSPIDISDLSVSSYQALKLRAWFSSDDVTTSPDLDDWSVDWFATPTSLSISPEDDSIVAGEAMTYTVIAHDDYGQSWEVTADSQYTITLAAGGHWADHVYTSEFADTWTVTSTHGSLAVTTSLTVEPATALTIEITPDPEAVTAGEVVTYTVMAMDTYGNTWEVTDATVFTITLGAGGSWADNVYTGETAGTWIVTGAYSSLVATARLTVNPGALHHFAFDAIGDQTAGVAFSVTITAQDEHDNTVTGYGGTASLTDTTGTINPTATGSFTNGVWTGNVTITDAGSDVTITAEDGGASGTSDPFDVFTKIYLPLVMEGE